MSRVLSKLRVAATSALGVVVTYGFVSATAATGRVLLTIEGVPLPARLWQPRPSQLNMPEFKPDEKYVPLPVASALPMMNSLTRVLLSVDRRDACQK